MTFGTYVNKLFYEVPYMFYVCMENANAQLDAQHKLDMSSLSILRNESDMTLRVRLKYQ